MRNFTPPTFNDRRIKEARLVNKLQFNEKGLIPAIIHDADTGEVLMLGYMNEESLRRTLSGDDVWFYSRSRQELWHKGETSGNYLKVSSVWKDCDSDTILVKAHPTGPVCHTGNKTCFFQQLTKQDIEASRQEES
ncbi:phosphoribosyl-AMP cyclohydrolase [Chloroflexota bacterium]